MGRLAMMITALWLMTVLLVHLPARAVNPLDTSLDLGIGIIGLCPKSNPPSGAICGLRPLQRDYSADVSRQLSTLKLHAKPHENTPVVGRLAFDHDGLLGIQTPQGFYNLANEGIPLGDGSYTFAVLGRHGSWIQIAASQSPVTTGWLKLSPDQPMRFWLWYSFFQRLVRAKAPLVFISPLHDDLLRQPDPKALSVLKNVYELECSILHPQKLQGAYMLVQAQTPADCQTDLSPEQAMPLRGWIRWLRNNGRPIIYRYFKQAPAP